jgi:aryl-alcohol dehydrogenase-like predicted oxidoreductase
MDEVLTDFCRERGIGLINASGLHMGLLTNDGGPDWHPAPQEVRAAARKAAQYCRDHGADISELGLRFCLDHPYVSSTLVGISTTRDLEASLKVLRVPRATRSSCARSKPFWRQSSIASGPQGARRTVSERPATVTVMIFQERGGTQQ